MCVHGILNSSVCVDQNLVPKKFQFQFAKNSNIWIFGHWSLSGQIKFLMFASYKDIPVSV